MEIPIYLFTGFLDAGKTKFIQETLEDPRFYSGERTLVILCEEGEEELNSSKFPSENVFIHTISNENDLNEKYLRQLQKKYRMNRILIEYNGMWNLQSLYNSLPNNWVIYQEMLFIDSQTIESYNANMRNLVADKLYNCEMVIFNRVKKDADLMPYHKLVRGISRSANIAYEYIDGEVTHDDIEDPLPFDINSDIIEIKDIDFAIWYRDLMEEPEKYLNKTIKFKGIVAISPELGENCFAVGRHIMTCCVDDITFGGLVAKWNETEMLETRDWVWVTAVLKQEFHKLYDSEGPVLYVKELTHTLPPKQELATFY